MSSGLAHLAFTGLFAICFLLGGVAIDIDHLRTHSIKEMWSGFLGKAKLNYREDSKHIFHNVEHLKIMITIVICLMLFTIGWALHLKMDGII